MFELKKEFRFDAAHTLQRSINGEPSRRIHGHSYRAEVTIRGFPDPETGMILDLSRFELVLEDARQALDHRFLDEMNDLGPATMENLCVWIWRRLAPACPGLVKVEVLRDSTRDSCAYFGEARQAA